MESSCDDGEQKVPTLSAIGPAWPDTRKPRVSSSAAVQPAALIRPGYCCTAPPRPQIQQAVQTLRSRNGTLREVSADLCQLAVTSSRRRSVRALSHTVSPSGIWKSMRARRSHLAWRPPASHPAARPLHDREAVLELELELKRR
jgi:hypothetical protein